MSNALKEYSVVRDDVIDVDLAAPPIERWRTVLRDHGDEVRSLVRDVRQALPGVMGKLESPWDRIASAMIKHSAKLGLGVSLVGRAYQQEYVDEIRGASLAVDLPFGDLMLANLMYDLVQLWDRGRRILLGGCSSFSCNLPDGTPVLARNLDWSIPESLGRHTILVRFHRGKQCYSSVHVLGSIGVLSAMSPRRWAVTVNQAPASKLTFQPTGVPVMIRVRQCCDKLLSFPRMAAELQALQTTAPFFGHLVGTGPSQHQVICGLGASFSSRKLEEEFLIQTNHFVCTEHVGYNDPDQREDADGATWSSDSKPRYEALRRRMRILPVTVDQALTKLARAPVTHGATMQQMVLHPSSGALRLRVRD